MNTKEILEKTEIKDNTKNYDPIILKLTEILNKHKEIRTEIATESKLTSVFMDWIEEQLTEIIQELKLKK